MNRIAQTLPLQFDTCYSPFPAAAFDRGLTFLHEQGFDGVELAVAHPNDVDGTALKRKLDSLDLVCTSLATGQAYAIDGLYLSAADSIVRRKAVDLILGHVDLSVALGGCPVTIGLLRGKCENGNIIDYLENFQISMSSCIQYASSRGITLQIEPLRRQATSLLNSTFETLEFIAALGKPACLGILYDTYHSSLEDGDMLAAIHAAAGKLTNIHLADSNRGLPGTGNLPFDKLYQAIQETAYTGAYALEVLNKPSAEYVNQHCANSIRNIVKKDC